MIADFKSFLLGYGVATLTLSSCLLIRPEYVLVEALTALLIAGCMLTAFGKSRRWL